MKFKAHQPGDFNEDEYFYLDDEAVENINSEYAGSEDFDDEYYDAYPKKSRRLRRIIFKLLLLCFIVVTINIGILFFTGKIWFNQPDKSDYPIRGALVDSSFGKINWTTFSKQNISTAYIRATKGTAFNDEKFEQYWEDSKNSELLIGAYHVFSLTKDGEKQAKHFCEAMGDSINGRLIPAVEIKLSGIYALFPPDNNEVAENLSDFCDYITEKYGVKALIICNKRSYEKYFSKDFEDYNFFVKSYFSQPEENLSADFWGYNPRVRVNGYENTKEYFTMFVYNENIDIDTFKKEFVC